MKWRLLTHCRDKSVPPDFQERVLLHIPIGFIIIILALAHWVVPLVLGSLFLMYEKNEDLHTQDEAWKDLFGAIAGAVMAGFVLLGLKYLL